ncbi:hypothetical protein [Deinococcus enclensis]|uniref:Uncharacterized protein n=1 Tax=Deinococcus enclensis TaxID=1049582 RepID=A0ABT9MBE5_9DEIO|nr:hypothetical protein [Deinococcus enclensis]MDP9763912.1 hypothetical protein [Deinococcus enclensis]
MTTPALPLTRAQRRRAGLKAALRNFTGLLLLGALAYLLWTPGQWNMQLLAWVLVVLLADELGGWFGYLGLALGLIGLFGPAGNLTQWLVIFPLVGGALMALLLVKHSGGPFVLPFGAALFAATLIGVGRYGTQVDPELKLPASDSFQQSALLAMLIGVGVSFIRQVVEMILRARARHHARQETVPLLLATPEAARGTGPAGTDPESGAHP